MAKSNAVLLREALEAGDLEKAKVLIEKVAPQPVKKAKKAAAPKPKAVTSGKAPKRPAKASPKKKAVSPPHPAEDASDAKPGASVLVLPPGYGSPTPQPGVIDIADLRGGRFTAAGPTPQPGIHLMGESRPRGSKVDKNGRVRHESRRVSMAGDLPKIVPLKDNGRGGYDADFKGVASRIDQENGRQDAEIYRRPPEPKVKCHCEGCRREFTVFLSHLSVRTDEDMSSDYFYICPKCCKQGRGL